MAGVWPAGAAPMMTTFSRLLTWLMRATLAHLRRAARALPSNRDALRRGMETSAGPRFDALVWGHARDVGAVVVLSVAAAGHGAGGARLAVGVARVRGGRPALRQRRYLRAGAGADD